MTLQSKLFYSVGIHNTEELQSMSSLLPFLASPSSPHSPPSKWLMVVYFSFVRTFTDNVYNSILCLSFIIISVIASLLPSPIGPLVYFIQLSWLYSFYCFEYVKPSPLPSPLSPLPSPLSPLPSPLSALPLVYQC